MGEINKGKYSFFLLSLKRKEDSTNAANVYENQASSPISSVHVIADGCIDDGNVTIQYC